MTLINDAEHSRLPSIRKMDETYSMYVTHFHEDTKVNICNLAKEAGVLFVLHKTILAYNLSM
jgi:hypothetical protein